MKKISHGKSEELGKVLKGSVHQTSFARESIRKSWEICCDIATEQTGVKHLCIVGLLWTFFISSLIAFWCFSLISLGSWTAQGTVKMELGFHLRVSHSVAVDAAGPFPWVGALKCCCFLLYVHGLVGFAFYNSCLCSLPFAFLLHLCLILRNCFTETWQTFMWSSIWAVQHLWYTLQGLSAFAFLLVSFPLCSSAMFFHIKPWHLCGNQAAVEPHVHLLVMPTCVASCVPEKTVRETSSFPNWETEFYSFSKKVNNRFCQSSPLGIVLFQVEPFCFKLTY